MAVFARGYVYVQKSLQNPICNNAARRNATLFGKLNRLIKTYLPARWKDPL